MRIPLYDADGNKYFVAAPADVHQIAGMPLDIAAASSGGWAADAIREICADGAGSHRSHGLLVGPFALNDAFGLLIVNTNGTLAERSGNGLTIFAQHLVAAVHCDRTRPFVVRIHHDRTAPLDAPIEPAELDGEQGFWIDMGAPRFGWQAVGATESEVRACVINDRDANCVVALQEVNADWSCSQFVSVGNPHCVTFLRSSASLAQLDAERSALIPPLTAIAFSSVHGAVRGAGRPCKYGVNLQWAVATKSDQVEARVFERDERWTPSSGSSATAVASAARHLGLTGGSMIHVVMPGGTKRVRFDGERALLFGRAQRIGSGQ